jgi:hypothetical protein
MLLLRSRRRRWRALSELLSGRAHRVAITVAHAGSLSVLRGSAETSPESSG